LSTQVVVYIADGGAGQLMSLITERSGSTSGVPRWPHIWAAA